MVSRSEYERPIAGTILTRHRLAFPAVLEGPRSGIHPRSHAWSTLRECHQNERRFLGSIVTLFVFITAMNPCCRYFGNP